MKKRIQVISPFIKTPEHIQHWLKASFVKLVSQYFDVIEIKSPLPWTMLLAKSKK